MSKDERRAARTTRETGSNSLKERVPELGNPWRMAVLFAILISSSIAFTGLFWQVDPLLACGPLVSQLVVVALLSAVQYYSMRHLIYQIRAQCRATGTLPSWVLPAEFALIFGPYYACLLHPLFVGGKSLLPPWLAVSLDMLIILLSLLMNRPSVLGGFSLAHSLGIYMFFPEEGSRVSGGIYSYLRHPIYAMHINICLALALLRNSLLAILTAAIFAVQNRFAVRWEDEELIERFGEEHRRYVSETPAMFPRLRDLGKFLRLLFSGEGR